MFLQCGVFVPWMRADFDRGIVIRSPESGPLAPAAAPSPLLLRKPLSSVLAFGMLDEVKQVRMGGLFALTKVCGPSALIRAFHVASECSDLKIVMITHRGADYPLQSCWGRQGAAACAWPGRDDLVSAHATLAPLPAWRHRSLTCRVRPLQRGGVQEREAGVAGRKGAGHRQHGV
jgi:hypothetical protein